MAETKPDEKKTLLRPSLGVGAVTLVSRLLGLVRVRLEASVLGGGALASAWFLAFSIPNLFRRILGEGALGTALTPLIAGIEKERGREEMRRELAVIFIALSCVLALIVIAASLLAVGLRRYGEACNIAYLCNQRMNVALRLLPLLMPYAFFMCLVGAATAVLNYARVFVLPALGALLLNIFLISGLFVGLKLHVTVADLPDFLPVLSGLVLVSGVCQLILTLLLLYFCGRFPRIGHAAMKQSKVVGKLFRLSLPGMIAASVLQISFLVDRMLAVKLNDQAVPALTFVDRLIDLPIGIFAVSLGSVLMASMSRAAAEEDYEKLRDQMLFSLRHVYFVCTPMALCVIVFHAPLLRVLCLGGNYTASDLDAARSVAVFYGAGIPFFCSLKILLPAFYARRKMKQPLFASLIAIGTNIVLNLLLMGPLRQGGIALATTISSILNNSILLCLLKKDSLMPDWKEMLFASARALGLSLAVVFLLWKLYSAYEEELMLHRWLDISATVLLFASAGVLYLVFAGLIRSPETGELFSVLRRRK
ncbi:MAG: murein biosynthesis integral membrane protein MurJ [Lentisphaeria bacterium]|nr:murein biosynthesis integral membrane protein MurJ [Lentisphaeria bacterium]